VLVLDDVVDPVNVGNDVVVLVYINDVVGEFVPIIVFDNADV
jgi:hypothetical protein